MNLDPAAWLIRTGMPALLTALGADQGEVRLVGGAVRDALLQLPAKDIDLATVHAPEQAAGRVRAAGFKAVPTGIAHGTITAILPSSPIEVTTLRRDIATDGRHALVAFTDDWREDAARRDFTINALLADPFDGRVHDYFDGVADLRAARVRFIGDPLQRIAEDHLRILRFFRFQARFGRSQPDAAALAACAARANDLMTLSRERIAAELLALLTLPAPCATVALMVEHGIFRPVLPEIGTEGVARLAALLAREAACGIAPDPLRRLAALLPVDPDVAVGVATRLKLSNAARARLGKAAALAPDVAPEALAYELGPESAIDQLLLHGTASPACSALARLAGWIRPHLPVSGGDLIALGLPQGPIVARTLRRVETRWVEAGFPGVEEARAIASSEVAQALAESA